MKALRDEIIVRPVYVEQKTSIIIPKSAKEFKQYHGQVYGVVMAIGEKYPYRDDLKVGDKVIWQRHEGKKIYVEDELYFVLKERWVQAIIKEDKK